MRNGFTETNTDSGKAAILRMFATFEENAYPEDLDTVRTWSAIDLATVIAHAFMSIGALGASGTLAPDQTEKIRAAAYSAHTLALSELARRAEVSR
jgi:predicted SnoaL-like aldol condensation-catalyzing enzyme